MTNPNPPVQTLIATPETLNAARIMGTRVALVHRINSGETRLRVGVIEEVRYTRASARLYVVIHDEVKGQRGFYASSITEPIRVL